MTSRIFEVEAQFKLFWTVITRITLTESQRVLEILVVPRKLKKVNFSPERPTVLEISDMKP